jgi:hypothetical protein
MLLPSIWRRRLEFLFKTQVLQRHALSKQLAIIMERNIIYEKEAGDCFRY